MRHGLVVALSLLTAMACAAGKPQLASVELRANCTFAGEVILLGDIANLLPTEAAAEYASIEVSAGPVADGERVLTSGYVRSRLRRAGLSLTGVAFSGAASARVTCSAAPVPEGPEAAAEAPTTSAPVRAAAALSVHAGSELRLVFRSGGLIVETAGELLKAASVGGIARVRVPQTRAIVQARLLTPELAEVIR